MGQCIVVTSGKGGVGKTTVTTNLGVSLAKQGFKTVLVDADIGLRNLDIILGEEQQILWDYIQVLQGQCLLHDALVASRRLPNLWMLPASQKHDKRSVTPDDMLALVSGLEEQFDYVLVDCPAGIEQGFYNAIAAADRAVVVVTPEISSLRDADRVMDLLQRNRITDIQILINRFHPELAEQGDMLNVDDIFHLFGMPLLGVLPESVDVLIASNRGEPVAFNDNTLITETFRRSSLRLQGIEVPFMNLNSQEPVSLWGKVKKWAKDQGVG